MIIYKITNKTNGKSYIGQTTRKINCRVREHKSKETLIGRAMKEHGEDNFTFEIIEKCNSHNELDEREAYWIKKLNTLHPKGYNQAIVDSKYGKFNGFFGKNHKPETIKRNQLNQPSRRMVRCVDTGEVFSSLRECERKMGVSRTKITNSCKGKVKNPKGLRFEYVS